MPSRGNTVVVTGWGRDRDRGGHRIISSSGRALDVLTAVWLGRGDVQLALHVAEEVVRLEPFREQGYRSLMRCHLAAGNRAETLRVYANCRALLAEELGIEPDPETAGVFLEALRGYLSEAVMDMNEFTASALKEIFGSLLPDVDRLALTGEFAEDITADLRGAVSTGIDGWLDDDLALVEPWGFDLDEIEVPVTLWHGTADRMAPVAEARVLAAAVPEIKPHLVDGEGHLSRDNHGVVGLISASRWPRSP